MALSIAVNNDCLFTTCDQATLGELMGMKAQSRALFHMTRKKSRTKAIVYLHEAEIINFHITQRLKG